MNSDRRHRYQHVKRAILRRVSEYGPLPPLPSDPDHGNAYQPKPGAFGRWVDEVVGEVLDAVDEADQEGNHEQ